jgi:hypothetical protein
MILRRKPDPARLAAQVQIERLPFAALESERSALKVLPDRGLSQKSTQQIISNRS